VASLLAIVLFGIQVMGQTLSAQTVNQAVNQTQPLNSRSDNSVSTIRLAQVDSGTTTPDWTGEIDIDPPVIDHEALETGQCRDATGWQHK